MAESDYWEDEWYEDVECEEIEDECNELCGGDEECYISCMQSMGC